MWGKRRVLLLFAFLLRPLVLWVLLSNPGPLGHLCMQSTVLSKLASPFRVSRNKLVADAPVRVLLSESNEHCLGKTFVSMHIITPQHMSSEK